MTTASRSGGNYEKAPLGMQQAVCAYVNDIGKQQGDYQGKPIVRHQVIITWELAEKKTQGNDVGKPFLVSKFYTLSLNEKATLCKDLESWRGKSFTEDELKGFELDKLIGANCYLNITETKTGKRAVSAVTPMPKGVPKIAIVQKEPPATFKEWIEELRGKSVIGDDAQPNDDDIPPEEKNSDLPF